MADTGSGRALRPTDRFRAASIRKSFVAFRSQPPRVTSPRVGFEAAATCIEWPDDPTAARPIAPGTPMPDVPVLVISGDLDANTPTSAGRELARQFAHATLAGIPNAGHVPTDTSPCVLELGMKFVATTTARANACAGTGTPPLVTPGAPLRVADLAPVHTAAGTPASGASVSGELIAAAQKATGIA